MFSEYKNNILKMMDENYKAFIQALLSVELQEDNQEILDRIYNKYMNSDNLTLINQNFYQLQKSLSQLLKKDDDI